MANFLERINNEANTQLNRVNNQLDQFYKKENSDNLQNQEEQSTILVPGTLKANEIYTVEDYKITLIKFLSEGTYAHVYLGEIVNKPNGVSIVDNKVVLKRVVISDNEEKSKLQNEIMVMKALKGKSNVIEYFASSIHPLNNASGNYEAFILMEYCSDGTLFDLMQAREPNFFNEKEILFIFHDICMGVAAMHYNEPPIIHRDIKVENVLISYNKRFKLCDFGSSTTEIIPPNTSLPMSKATQLESELDSCTTLQYRSPETIDLYMRRGLNEKIDIWALGILLFKLCYFITPFEDVGKLAILNCSIQFPSKPIIPNTILKLIHNILQEDPICRPNIYQLVKEVAKLRNVPCQLEEKIEKDKPEILAQTRIEPIQPKLDIKKVNYPPNNTFDFQTENITPMRRGRPTRNKSQSNKPDQIKKASGLPNVVIEQKFNSNVNNKDEVDPFEMLVNSSESTPSNDLINQPTNQPTNNENEPVKFTNFFHMQDNNKLPKVEQVITMKKPRPPSFDGNGLNEINNFNQSKPRPPSFDGKESEENDIVNSNLIPSYNKINQSKPRPPSFVGKEINQNILEYNYMDQNKSISPTFNERIKDCSSLLDDNLISDNQHFNKYDIEDNKSSDNSSIELSPNLNYQQYSNIEELAQSIDSINLVDSDTYINNTELKSTPFTTPIHDINNKKLNEQQHLPTIPPKPTKYKEATTFRPRIKSRESSNENTHQLTTSQRAGIYFDQNNSLNLNLNNNLPPKIPPKPLALRNHINQNKNTVTSGNKDDNKDSNVPPPKPPRSYSRDN